MVRLALKRLLAKWNYESLFTTLKNSGIGTTDKLLSCSYTTILDILSEESEEDRENFMGKLAEFKRENVS